MKSITAGVVIGLGGLCYLSVDDKTVGAFLFSMGLLSVLIFGLDLYTGWVCRLEKYKKPVFMIGVLLGNFIGAFIIGAMSCYKYGAVSEAWALCVAKLDKGDAEWFVMSVFCGIFIAVAVYAWLEARSYLVVVLAVMGFILSGSEHVIADMYYFTTARMIFEFDVLLRLLVCATGNMIGGAIIGILFEFCKGQVIKYEK